MRPQYSHMFHFRPVVVTWLHGWPIGMRPQWAPCAFESTSIWCVPCNSSIHTTTSYDLWEYAIQIEEFCSSQVELCLMTVQQRWGVWYEFRRGSRWRCDCIKNPLWILVCLQWWWIGWRMRSERKLHGPWCLPMTLWSAARARNW